MAIVVKELRNGNTTTSALESGAGVRAFSVYDDEGMGVARGTTYGLLGLPVLNDPHPENGSVGLPNLFADSILRQPWGNGVLVTVSYSDRPRTGGPIIPVNPLADGFLSIDISYRIERVELPVFAVSKITVGEEAEAVEKFVWERLEGDYSFDKSVHTYTARLNGSLGEGLSLPGFFAAGESIDAQANKIHTINGKKYRYVPRGLRQQTVGSGDSPALYEIHHSWDYDPGVPNTLVGRAGYSFNSTDKLVFYGQPVGTPPVPLFTHAYPQQDASFMIRPFTTLRTFANPGDLSVPPKMDFAPAYPEEPNGWQTLPGLS